MKIQRNDFVKVLALSAAIAVSNIVGAAPNEVRLSDHVPSRSIARARELGRASAGQSLSLAIPLQPKNVAELEVLIQRLHTPGDSLYGKYLTADEFTERFAPSAA